MELPNSNGRKNPNFVKSLWERVRWKDIFLDLPLSIVISDAIIAASFSINNGDTSNLFSHAAMLLVFPIIGSIGIIFSYFFPAAIVLLIVLLSLLLMIFGLIRKRIVRIIALVVVISIYIIYGMLALAYITGGA